jgi:prephenate dehydrogenase
MRTEIFLVGLNETSLSIGLGLAQSGSEITRIGFDPNHKIAVAARKQGELDRVARNIERAAKTADIILLSSTVADIRMYLETLAPHLKQGAVILDLSPLKTVSLQLAEKVLPDESYLVGILPVLNPNTLHAGSEDPARARPDLFEGGLLAISVLRNTPEDVVDLAITLAQILKAEPFFIEPAEADSMLAVVEGLPALLGTSLFQYCLHSPGWREIQRMLGRPWVSWVKENTQSPEALAARWIENKANLLTHLDGLLDEIEALRTLITQEDEEALQEQLSEGSKNLVHWIDARKKGNWSHQETAQPSIPKTSFFKRLFGFGRPKREDAGGSDSHTR